MATNIFKRLPLGISDFRKIIAGNYLYVDKTPFIYQMIHTGDYYFLSRPRRFGKSLLISILDALFSGNKELFKDLWIYTSDYNWQEYPVIRIDFSAIGNHTLTELQLGIQDMLEAHARQYQISLQQQQTIGSKFQELITQLAKKNKVVILIDEYDKPILDHIDNPEEAKAQREMLKNLYSIIKGSDQYIRFVLLTGVSKFAKTSIFSGLNNLDDISLDQEYATLLGYTPDELNKYFESHIKLLAQHLEKTPKDILDKLKNMYDGYVFAQNSIEVFNPYSILSCLKKKTFANYWFATYSDPHCQDKKLDKFRKHCHLLVL